ncbi:MAG: AMIN domain-containing protein [Candidatus Electrothrix sp. AR4]|nr:AMIN domain-containing protein [Candidatus Electrothrix sp. AR4]
MFKNIFSTTIILVVLFFHAWLAAANQKMLEDISFESHSDGEERIVFKLNGTYIPKIFTLQGKQPRVVFDFNDTTTAKIINKIINTNGKLIKRIRVGIHEGADPKTRVVLDLRPNKNVDIRQDFDKKKNSLVVSVHYAGADPSKKVTASSKNQEEPLAKRKKVKEIAKAKPQPIQEKIQPVNSVTREKAPQTAQQNAPSEGDREIFDGPPVLNAVTFENDSNRGEMVLFKLNEFHPPIVFGIEEGTPRVVCDFKDTVVAKDLPKSLKTAGKYIQKVRIGSEKAGKKVRVVLDLTPNYSYDLQQVFFKDDNLFVIIINTLGNAPVTDPAEFLK